VKAEPKGVLHPELAARKFRLARYKPAEDLAPFVEHHWLVEWDLIGQPPHVQRTLPYPCVHLVFDPCGGERSFVSGVRTPRTGGTGIIGVTRGWFEARLEGAGRTLGVRFRPGGFRGFLGSPVSRITDRTLPIDAVFGTGAAAAEATVLAAADDEGMIRAAESIVRQRLPAPDAQVDLVHDIVQQIESDRTINRVVELANRLNMGERTLQRLFSDYVGVSPKWVIRRFRLHDAASRLANDEEVNLTTLAQELGYSDQAHFTRDFKAIVGRSPSESRTATARR
jgi:AraC-like DNA-binding protein